MPMCDAYIPEGPPHPRRAANGWAGSQTSCSKVVRAIGRRDDHRVFGLCHADVEFHWPPALPFAGLLGSGELTRQWPLIADVMCSRRDGHVQARLQEEASEDATIVQINPSSKQ